MGIYFFKPTIFDVISELKPSWRSELDITDAIRLMMYYGYKFGYSFVEGWWIDTGKKDDVLYANMLVLDERIKRDMRGELENRVSVGENIKLVNSIVRGAAIIGSGCLIENALIGPYTSVGNGVRIINSCMENCIILENALIENIDRLEDSLIGRSTKVMKKNIHSIIKSCTLDLK